MAAVASFITTLLGVVIALPKIGEQVKQIVGLVVAWWMSIQDEKTAHAIADAAAFALRAKTQEERYEASERWKAALSRKSSS